MLLVFLSSTHVSHASATSGTIDTTLKYAWGENTGWINFAAPGSDVTVTDAALTGDIWNDNYGWINLAPTLDGVTNNAEGVLDGSAWTSGLGWIDFSGVSIDSTGRFHGSASGVLSGTITFDCAQCAVQTDWRPASARAASSETSGGGGSGGGNGPPVVAPTPSPQTPIPIFPAAGAETPEVTVDARSTIQPSRNVAAAASAGEAQALALFDITLSSEGLRSSAAPGESIAFSVQLSNFGSQKRADVTVFFRLFDERGTQVYAESETVAVDTTASFVKRIPVPEGALPGAYTVETSLSYAGQEVPATSRFTFTVGPPVRMTDNSAIYFAGIALALLLILGLVYTLRVRSRGRFVIHDYSDKPKEERIYYEIISDTIGQMRQRAGDRALDVATHTQGLVVDEKTGRVLKITDSPAKVVAGLVSGYEKALGKKVSFSFRTDTTL
ncbi:MAG: hypothetical protein NUV59_02205 [Patescibacteria group bacterium]|nr:hypothetical protein [Patescibacteria group bacterium]